MHFFSLRHTNTGKNTTGTTAYVCNSTGYDFVSTPTIDCRKRCDYPIQLQLDNLNFANGNCSVGTPNALGYGKSCEVTCAPGSHPPPDGVQPFVCDPAGTGTLTVPTGCIPGLFSQPLHDVESPR